MTDTRMAEASHVDASSTPAIAEEVVLAPLVVGRIVDGVPELVDPMQPLVTAFDLGLVRGDGVFESLLVRNGAVRGVSAHLSRMANSTAILGMQAPDGAAWAALIAACAEAWPDDLEGVLKLVMTRGLEGMTAPPTCLATLTPLHPDVLRQRKHGVSVRLLSLGVSADERARSPWLLGGAKSLSYATNMASIRQAKADGADDVIFVSADGQVLEGPTSTVIWSSSGVLHTPPLETGILPGTTQVELFDKAAQSGWGTAVVTTTPADLAAAEAVWLVSSVRGATPVTSIDGVPRDDAGLTPAVLGLLDLVD